METSSLLSRYLLGRKKPGQKITVEGNEKARNGVVDEFKRQRLEERFESSRRRSELLGKPLIGDGQETLKRFNWWEKKKVRFGM